MTRSPLQYHRSRLPAIPPKSMATRTGVTFETNSLLKGETSEAWSDILKLCGLPASLSSSVLLTNPKEVTVAATLEGLDLKVAEHSYGFYLTVAITAPPLISPRLAATFPWKLRKYIAAQKL